MPILTYGASPTTEHSTHTTTTGWTHPTSTAESWFRPGHTSVATPTSSGWTPPTTASSSSMMQYTAAPSITPTTTPDFSSQVSCNCPFPLVILPVVVVCTVIATVWIVRYFSHKPQADTQISPYFDHSLAGHLSPFDINTARKDIVAGQHEKHDIGTGVNTSVHGTHSTQLVLSGPTIPVQAHRDPRHDDLKTGFHVVNLDDDFTPVSGTADAFSCLDKIVAIFRTQGQVSPPPRYSVSNRQELPRDRLSCPPHFACMRRPLTV